MSRDLFGYLRRKKLDSLLFRIANVIRVMFDRNEPVMTVPVVRTNGIYPKQGKVTISAWNLSDLAYMAICETNDFGDIEPLPDHLVALCNFFLL